MQLKPRIVLVALLFASGCNSDANSASNLRDRYLGSPAAIEKKLVTQYKQVEKCMRARGFEYVAFNPISTGTIRIGPIPEVFQSPASLRRTGYGISRTGEGDPNLKIVARLSGVDRVAYSEALFGTVSGKGCLAETAGFARIETPSWASEAVRASNDAIRSDRRTVRLVLRWSQCMRRNNFAAARYSSPEDPGARLQAFAFQFPLKDISKDEMKIAKADADCTDKVYPEYVKIRSEYDAKFFKNR